MTPQERNAQYKHRYHNDPEFRAKRLAASKKRYQIKGAEIREYQSRYRKAHRPELRAYHNKYRKERCARDPAFRERLLENAYRARRKPERKRRFNAYRRKRRQNDPQYRFSEALRHRINKALRGIGKSAHTMELLGCTVAELHAHLESLWQPGMNWENYGYWGWHVDHIRPCSSFDLTDPEQQKACFHYTNLQPLWRKDNQIKSDTLL